MDPRGNLLVRLHKWANRQDENFVSESFAFVLQHLIEEEPAAAAGLLRSMTAGFFALTPAKARTIAVRTQIITGEGTPDLSLTGDGQLAYVEVKVGSPASGPQLDKYRKLLAECGVPNTRLVLLTRYVPELDPKALTDVLCVRWYQVAEWLDGACEKSECKEVSRFVVRQFLGLLSGRGMTMGQVGWELTGGVRALRTFLDMLEETLSAHSQGVLSEPLNAKFYARSFNYGFYLEDRAYWIGLSDNYEGLLIFQTHRRTVDPQVAKDLRIDGVYPWESKSRDKIQRYGWWRAVDLRGEETFFFARSIAGQRQYLEHFVKDCLEKVRRIELAGVVAESDTEADGNAPDGV